MDGLQHHLALPYGRQGGHSKSLFNDGDSIFAGSISNCSAFSSTGSML